MKIFLLIVCSLSVLAFGCSKSQPSDSREPNSSKSDSAVLQGTWIEQEETATKGAKPASLVINGSSLEFHDVETNGIIKATFSLREDKNPKQLIGVITADADSENIGKKFNALYKIQDVTLTITANEPGDPAMPTGFDAPDMDKLIFKKK